MQAIFNWITKTWVNQSIGLLFFVVGIGLGLLIGVIVLRGAKREIRENRVVPKREIELIKNQAKEEYQKDDSEFEIKKITLLLEALSVLCEEIPKEYDKKAKFYTVLPFSNASFLDKDVKACLDFTVGEGLEFLQALVDVIEFEVFSFLGVKYTKKLYGKARIIGGLVIKQTLSKDVKDILIADLYGIIQKLFGKKDKPKKKGLTSKIISKYIGGVLNRTNEEIEDFIIDFIDKFGDILNDLYSGSFKDGVNSIFSDSQESDLEVV